MVDQLAGPEDQLADPLICLPNQAFDCVGGYQLFVWSPVTGSTLLNLTCNSELFIILI